MSSTDTRPGFRLPWSSDRTNHGDRPSDQEAEHSAVDPQLDGAPEHRSTTRDAGAAAEGSAQTDTAGWPAVEFRPRLVAVVPLSPPNPEAEVIPAPDAPARRADAHRRPTKFLADLTAAMRAASESGREQTLAQFQADAKTCITGIHEVSATEATTLRKAADEDVAGIREWSKAEIARIRDETDARIAARKVSLDGELEAHAGSVERRMEAIQGAIVAFESEMASFFTKLHAETDPAAFAAMAERMPEPPSIEGFTNPDVAREWSSSASSSTGFAEGQPGVSPERDVLFDGFEADDAEGWGDLDSAEAEAALAARMDTGGVQSSSFVNRLTELTPRPAVGDGEPSTSQIVVTGLVSVASIASFKRHLGRVSGVSGVTVSSGPDGEFVFSATHRPDVSLNDVVASLPGFGAHVIHAADGVVTVTAHDPESDG